MGIRVLVSRGEGSPPAGRLLQDPGRRGSSILQQALPGAPAPTPGVQAARAPPPRRLRLGPPAHSVSREPARVRLRRCPTCPTAPATERRNQHTSATKHVETHNSGVQTRAGTHSHTPIFKQALRHTQIHTHSPRLTQTQMHTNSLHDTDTPSEPHKCPQLHPNSHSHTVFNCVFKHTSSRNHAGADTS